MARRSTPRPRSPSYCLARGVSRDQHGAPQTPRNYLTIEIGSGCLDFASRHPATAAPSLLGTRPSDGFERVGLEHHDAAAFETYPIALLPVPQLLVRALSRHADHLPDLAL